MASDPGQLEDGRPPQNHHKKSCPPVSSKAVLPLAAHARTYHSESGYGVRGGKKCPSPCLRWLRSKAKAIFGTPCLPDHCCTLPPVGNLPMLPDGLHHSPYVVRNWLPPVPTSIHAGGGGLSPWPSLALHSLPCLLAVSMWAGVGDILSSSSAGTQAPIPAFRARPSPRPLQPTIRPSAAAKTAARSSGRRSPSPVIHVGWSAASSSRLAPIRHR